MIAPTLNAMTGATLATDVALTFTTNPAWQSAITGITVDGETARGYDIDDGVITIQWRNFERAMDSVIVVTATGYDDATVSQTITVAKYQDLVFFEVEDETDYPITNDDLADFEPHFADLTGKDDIHAIVAPFVGREIRKFWYKWEEKIRQATGSNSINCLNYIKNPRILKELMIYYALTRLFSGQQQHPDDMFTRKQRDYANLYSMECKRIIEQLEFDSPIDDYEPDYQTIVRLVR